MNQKKPFVSHTEYKGRIWSRYHLCWCSCPASPCLTGHPVTWMSREYLCIPAIPVLMSCHTAMLSQYSGSKATFHISFSGMSFSRWTSLSAKSLCVLFFLTTFVFLLFLSYEGTHGLSTVFLDLFLAAKNPPVNASGIVNIIINGDDLHPYRLYSYSSSDSSSSTIAAAAPDTADTTATTVAMSTTKSKQIRKIHNPVSVIFLSISMCTLQMVSLSDFSCTCCTPTHPIFFLPIINNSIAQNCLVYQWHRQRFLIKNETTCLAVSFFIVQQFFTNFWTDLLPLYTTKCNTLYDMFW